MNRSLFEKLLASDERYREGATSVIRQFNGKYQRGAKPSPRILQRRVANQKASEQAASQRRSPLYFLQLQHSPQLQHLKRLISSLKRKTVIIHFDKEIHSKNQAMNEQNMMHHQEYWLFFDYRSKENRERLGRKCPS